MSHVVASGRRDFLLALAYAALTAPGASRSEVLLDQDYRQLPRPQPRLVSTGVEVIEFFSYGCEACFRFHPLVTRWAGAQPPDVSFVRIPYSIGRPRWAALVPTYYALRECGALARLDNELFQAIHENKMPLFDETTIVSWAAANGIDAGELSRVLHSANVLEQTRRAEQMGRDYAVVGIPTIVVNGRYVVRGPKVRNYDDLLRVTTALVERERRTAVPADR